MRFTQLSDAVWTHFGQAGAEAGFDPFLPLAPITEPHSDHLLLQVEAFCDPGYFLGGWFTFFHKAVLKSFLSAQAGLRIKQREREKKSLLKKDSHKAD